MKYTRLRHLLALAAAIAVVLPAASDTFAQSKGTIKIASQSPLSGGQAALGEGMARMEDVHRTRRLLREVESGGS